jgi:pseudaminic acid synthase
MKIHNREISLKNKPFIIAEMSGNHNQSLDRAINIVEVAAKVGVDAIKLQTYTADTITLNVNKDEFIISDENSLWHGRSLYNLYEEAHTPWEWHEPIMKKANELGIICFSSPFDETAVDFLEELNFPAYKIASPEIIHIPLIEKIVSTGKPIIASTGMASLREIDEAINIIKNNNYSEFALLKCTSTYPASAKDSNIKSISNLRKLYNCEVGLSDHTMGIGAAVAAVAHGATIVEKHFTLDRSDG